MQRFAERGHAAARRALNRTALGLIVLAAVFSCAWPTRVEAQAVDQVVAIRAGQLFDGTGETLRRGVTILIRGDRIVEIGEAVTVPAGATTIDLSDWTVLPGLIDMHTHLTSDPVDGYADRRFRDFPGHAALVGAKNARVTLLAGFTTVRNLGATDFADIALRNAINEGMVVGPRVLTAGKGLGITGGHCDTGGFRPDLFEEPGIERGIANGVDEVRAAVRYQVKYGADMIKTCATAGVLSAGTEIGPAQYTLAELEAMVETAGMLNRRVVAHAHGLDGIRNAVRAGVASIDHGSVLDDDVIRLMRERGTFLDDFGTLERGRRADIIAVRGDPLRDVEVLKNVGFVMRDGVVYKRDGEPVARAR